MKLLIDAGNTRIKWAAVTEQVWFLQGVLALEQAELLPQHLAEIDEVNEIWVSNVAGDRALQGILAAAQMLSVPTNFIRSQHTQCGVTNCYQNHAQLGSDRWAALIAAWELVKDSCLVVNSGTATTIDALSCDGEFIGGLILPGIDLMQRSLFAATAIAPQQHGVYQVFPHNTFDGLYSGAIQATCGAIEKQHALLQHPDAPVILSGGAAEVLEEQLDAPVRLIEHLVLRGLWQISQQNN